MYKIQEIGAHQIMNCTDPDADWYIVVDGDNFNVTGDAMTKEEAEVLANELNKEVMTKFEEFRMVFTFLHPIEGLKGWVNEENYNNLFVDDWNVLMPIVEKCYHIEVDEDSNLIGDLSCALMNTDIIDTYEACVELIKYLNEKK